MTVLTVLNCRRGSIRRYVWQDIKERCVTVGWATDVCRCVLSVFLSYFWFYFVFYCCI